MHDPHSHRPRPVPPSLQAQLEHSQSSVKNLLVSTKTMGAELEAAQRAIKQKSDQIIHLLQKSHNDTATSQKVTTSLQKEKADLQRALTSAQWLAQTAQAKHESQLRELTLRCDALDKRCQHMDVLERQNVELCAIARQQLSQKEAPSRTVTSHVVQDVASTTSPPGPSLLSPGNKTVAAVTAIAGLAILSTARHT
jgi:hypothetical protein